MKGDDFISSLSDTTNMTIRIDKDFKKERTLELILLLSILG